MILFDLSIVAGASWPWGPPGAQLFDVLAVYGLIALLVGLIVWNAVSAPRIGDGQAQGTQGARPPAPATKPSHSRVSTGILPPSHHRGGTTPPPEQREPSALDAASVRPEREDVN